MKKTCKMILAFALCLLMGLSALPALCFSAAAEETGGLTLEDWNYWVKEEDGTVRLTEYVGTADTVVVPSYFEAEGRNCPVIVNGPLFSSKRNVNSVSFDEGVSFEESMSSLFSGCSSLTHVDLSGVSTAGVKYMDSMFAGCGSLKDLDLSSFDTSSVLSIRRMFSNCQSLSGLTGYENWDTSSLQNMSYAFNYFVYTAGSKVPVTVDLRNWDLSHIRNNCACFQYSSVRRILLPENLAVISAYFLNHAIKFEGSSFTVPAGVKKIGYAHTFYDFGTNDMTEILVAEGNTNYKSVDGVLYSADGTEMLAVPLRKRFENKVFEIPEGVEFLGELSFSKNPYVTKLILPDSFEIKYVPYGNSRYVVYGDTGNINVGTNLSIAIYIYTNINDYTVKDTNPRYTSVNGIVYSKNMDVVVAIPMRYNGVMDIPEGVARWEREAMWADGEGVVDSLLSACPGVNIPSSMKAIATDQLNMLNRLHANRKNSSKPFTITVAEGNENFCLDENGCLTVIETPDRIAAMEAIAKINAIGTVEFTAACKAKIDAAQAAYDALTNEQKALVTNAQTLADAVARYNELKAAADQAAADTEAVNAVIEKINAIGTVEYTDESKAKIDAAQAAYDALTEAQKALVSNAQTLADAVARYNALKAEADRAAADRAAANAVIEKINVIGTVDYTDESKAKIDAAQAAYDALTDAQKALVSNVQKLTDAVARYNALKAEADRAAADRAAANAVIEKINAIGTVEYTDACKAKIDAARNAYNALTATQKALVTNVQALAAAANRYNELKAAAQASADPTEPAQQDPPAPPADPGTPAVENLCKWCGKPHTGFGGRIIGFFHGILYFFAHLFGTR